MDDYLEKTETLFVKLTASTDLDLAAVEVDDDGEMPTVEEIKERIEQIAVQYLGDMVVTYGGDELYVNDIDDAAERLQEIIASKKARRSVEE